MVSHLPPLLGTFDASGIALQLSPLLPFALSLVTLLALARSGDGSRRTLTSFFYVLGVIELALVAAVAVFYARTGLHGNDALALVLVAITLYFAVVALMLRRRARPRGDIE